MKKILLTLAVTLSLFSFSQIKVMNLPVITTGFDRWNLIVDTLGTGGTKRMSIANFKTAFFGSYISGSGTTNYMPIFTGSGSIGNGFLYQRGRNIVLPALRYITSTDTTRSQIELDTAYFWISTDGQTYDGVSIFGQHSSSNPSLVLQAGEGSNVSYISVSKQTNPSSNTVILSGTGKTTISTDRGLTISQDSLRYTDGNQGSGKVLTSDANGYATWQTSSGGISGLTTNYITKATSSTAIGNSSIQDNGTNIAIPNSTYLTNTLTTGATTPFISFDAGEVTVASDPSTNKGRLYLTQSQARFDYNNAGGVASIIQNSSGTDINHTGTITLNAGTKSIINTALQVNIASAGANKVLTSDASGNATWQNPATSGTVTSIATGNGITGGTITTTGTLGLSGATGDIGSFSGTNTYSAITAVATGYLLGSQGTSTKPAWLQAATLNTSLTTPLEIGGTTTTSTKTFRTTSGNATTGSDFIWQNGNNGATEQMRLLNSGALLIGTATQTSSPSGTSTLEVAKNQNSGTLVTISNTTSNTGAFTGFDLYQSGTAYSSIIYLSPGFTNSSNVNKPDGLKVASVGAGGVNLAATNSSGSIRFYVNGATDAAALRANINSSGDTYFGLGSVSASARVHAVSTTEQLRIGYDGSNYYSTTVGSTGGVTFNAVGSGSAFTFSDKIINSLPQNLKAYTVATLPAGTTGDVAYVTDATAPTYLGTLTGGGAVTCPVFYNGSAWVSH